MSTANGDLAGKTAVVTGGGSGLGGGITAAFLEAGANVVVLQRSAPAPELSALADRLQRVLRFESIDLGDADRIPDVAARILAEQQIDILVNNAAAQARHPAIDFTLEDFDRVLDVNLRAVFQLSQLFARPMVQRGGGKIINLASMLSFQGGVFVPAYAASKGAVAQLTKAFCNEWASAGVNVNAIAPGYMDTALNESLIADPVRSRQISERIPAGAWGRPSDVGDAAVFLASDKASYIHGTVLPVDGGWLAR